LPRHILPIGSGTGSTTMNKSTEAGERFEENWMAWQVNITAKANANPVIFFHGRGGFRRETTTGGRDMSPPVNTIRCLHIVYGPNILVILEKCFKCYTDENF